MNSPPSYRGYRFPPEIISNAVRLYHRFALNLPDIEDLLAERNVIVSYESIRQWCVRFGLDYAKRLRKRCCPGGDCWFLGEMSTVLHGLQPVLRLLARTPAPDDLGPATLASPMRGVDCWVRARRDSASN